MVEHDEEDITPNVHVLINEMEAPEEYVESDMAEIESLLEELETILDEDSLTGVFRGFDDDDGEDLFFPVAGLLFLDADGVELNRERER